MDCTDRCRNFDERSLSDAERLPKVEDRPRTSKDDMLSHTHASEVLTPVQDSTVAKATAKERSSGARERVRARASATLGHEIKGSEERYASERTMDGARSEREFPVNEEGAEGPKVKKVQQSGKISGNAIK